MGFHPMAESRRPYPYESGSEIHDGIVKRVRGLLGEIHSEALRDCVANRAGLYAASRTSSNR